VEGLVARGLEVLYLTDPIDEVAITNLGTFMEKTLIDVTKEDLDLGGDEDKAKMEEATREFAGLTAWLKETLNGKVENVVVSRRATDSPCLLVTSKFGWSANMEKIMRSQTMGDARAMEYMKGKKILEINPNHSIIRELRAAVAADADSVEAKNVATVLFETALLESGYSLEDAKGFADRVLVMAKASLNVDPAALAAADAADEAAEAAAPEAAEPAAEAASGHDEL
jgi:heat shock protein beta